MPTSGDSDDDSSESGDSDGDAPGKADGSDESDSEAEMDTLLLRDELRVQGDGGDTFSSSSSDGEGFSAPRRRCVLAQCTSTLHLSCRPKSVENLWCHNSS